MAILEVGIPSAMADNGEGTVTPRINKVTYKRGMVDSMADARRLVPTVWSGGDRPDAIIQSISDNDLLSLAGTYGDPGLGEPIEYDQVLIEHDVGTVEITFYNRGITLLFTDDEIARRIHRVCSALMEASHRPGLEPPGGADG